MKWVKRYDLDGSLQAILERIDSKKHLLDSFRPLPEILVRKFKENMSFEWTYHSNAIEGNTLLFCAVTLHDHLKPLKTLDD